ncbi:MAG: hypothetical protein IPN42_13505 [Methylococcaceae bacterium]|nr:hypothetical protein [Methylococcaceae bacterium]
MNSSDSSWIFSARFDSCFILAPAILVSLFAVLFSDQISQMEEMPSWLWLVLIVGIDAGHVYSTLFRTYLVRDELQHRQALLTLTPIVAWIAGCLLYSIEDLLFWRVLAYLALFHFIRQQYGFMMIYGRNERDLPDYYKKIDKAAIYLATLYPVIYWHCHERAFNWFVDDDFIQIDSTLLSTLVAGLYLVVLLLYAMKEFVLWQKMSLFNLPRNLLLFGTALSWYIGIVAFNTDLIFTATNVIAHGIPYYGLIWVYGYKQARMTSTAYLKPWIGRLFNVKAIFGYFGLLFALAFFEESLWDNLVWREHQPFFGFFSHLPAIDSSQTLAWLVPLLALPQTTHYLLDAFIWRLHRKDTEWKAILFYNVERRS